MKIAYVGYQVQEKYTGGVTNDEYNDLLNFLAGKGLDITGVVWNDKNIDWKDFEVVIIKSPWDYHENLAAFTTWLNMLSSLGIKVLNPVDIIKWNSDKHYLETIANNGLAVIQSGFLEKGSSFSDQYFELFHTDKLVVKPCVSAGAKNTLIIDKAQYAEQSLMVNKLLQEEAFLVQPFLEEIKGGEWSFIFFNGVYSHSALKTPKQGDFRVQHYHGGSISYPAANPLHIEQASQYVAMLPGQILYARVDGVVRNGAFELMELEVIDPYLFFNGNQQLLENYYRALVQQIA
jgi:glutathione synthase/RimK-type ligase-like ATP-grasp enzyme